MSTSGQCSGSGNTLNQPRPRLQDSASDIRISPGSIPAANEILAWDLPMRRWRNFPGGGGGPLAIRFLDLLDTQAAYTNPNSLIRVKPAGNGVSEMNLQATLPGANQFKLTSGTTDLTVTADCLLDQNLSISSSPQFANLTVNNKLTVTGPIDPTGIQLTKQSVNPLDSKSIWTDGTLVYFGSIPIGSNVAWWCSVETTIQAAMKSTATVTLTGAGGVGELATAMGAAVDGDVIEIQSNLGYSPVVIPTAKRLTLRVAQGYGAYLTGANVLTIPNGARDVTVVGLGWDTCTTVDANGRGSAIALDHLAVVSRIIFAQCNLRACAGSAVMLSYHQTIGGDNYSLPNVYPAEFSSNVAFVDCSFNKATTDGAEGAALALRGVTGALVRDCYFNCQGVGGRGIQLQNCVICWVEGNYVTGGAGTANGEGIKLDRLGAPAYLNSGYFIRNTSKGNKQGIDIDDFDSAVAIGNKCFKNTLEGLCLCGVGQTTVASNVCWENNDGIAIEVGVSSYKLYNNVSFLNTTNNFRLDGGGSPNDSNLTTQVSCATGADSVPFTTTGPLLSTNVNDALNEISSVSTLLKNPTGFTAAARTASTLSIVNGATPTFTLAGGPFYYYQSGIRRTWTTGTIPIADTQGLHYVYIDGVTLTETTIWDARFITEYVAVAIFYWSKGVLPAASAYLLLLDERHEFMDPATHYLEHETQGAQWIGGISLNSFTIGSGALDAHAQLGNDTGTLLDEDISHTIPTTAAPGSYYVFYRSGASGVWKVSALISAPLISAVSGTARITYNQWTGATWTLTEVSDVKFALVHFFAINSYAAGQRLIVVLGQSEYNSVNAARTGANTELSNLQVGGLPTAEWVAIGTVIYQTANTYVNTWHARVVVTDTGADYIDWRQKKALNSTTAPTSHHNLSDLNTFDDHPQKTQLSTPGAVTSGAVVLWNGTGGEYVKNSGVTVTGGSLTDVAGVGTLGVSGTITSSLTGATAKILDFGVSGTAGHYSYIGGGSVAYAFGIENSGGMFWSSDDWITMRLKTGGAGVFSIRHSAAGPGTPFDGSTPLWTCTTGGRISHASEATYYTSFLDDDTMAADDSHAICSQQSIKAYVDSHFGATSFNVTWTGIWAADIGPHIINFVRSGNVVSARFLSAHAVSNASAVITSTVACLPVSITPAEDQYVPILEVNGANGVRWGTLIVKTTGFLEVQDINQAFGNGVDAGIYSSPTATWNLA